MTWRASWQEYEISSSQSLDDDISVVLSQNKTILRHKVENQRFTHAVQVNYLFESSYTADPLHHQVPKGPAMSRITRVACRRQLSTLKHEMARLLAKRGGCFQLRIGTAKPIRIVRCFMSTEVGLISSWHAQPVWEVNWGSERGTFSVLASERKTVFVNGLISRPDRAQLRDADGCKPQIACGWRRSSAMPA